MSLLTNNNNNNNNNTARRLKTEVPREQREIKYTGAEETKERQQGKRMHGQLPRNLDGKLVDTEQAYR
jgi:hypothetical protein